jgi:hypothetical protein
MALVLEDSVQRKIKGVDVNRTLARDPFRLSFLRLGVFGGTGSFVCFDRVFVGVYGREGGLEISCLILFVVNWSEFGIVWRICVWFHFHPFDRSLGLVAGGDGCLAVNHDIVFGQAAVPQHCCLLRDGHKAAR